MPENETRYAHELAELVSSADAVPGSGWVAGASGALAAALVAKAAARSEGWSGAEGVRAQALELRDRLLALAGQDSRAYESALTALERKDSGSRQGTCPRGRGSTCDRRDRGRRRGRRRRGGHVRRRRRPGRRVCRRRARCGCRARRRPARRGEPGHRRRRRAAHAGPARSGRRSGRRETGLRGRRVTDQPVQ